MKKLIISILVIMMLGLAGCKKESNGEITIPSVTETEETVQEEVVTIPGDGEWGSAEFEPDP